MGGEGDCCQVLVIWFVVLVFQVSGQWSLWGWALLWVDVLSCLLVVAVISRAGSYVIVGYCLSTCLLCS